MLTLPELRLVASRPKQTNFSDTLDAASSVLVTSVDGTKRGEVRVVRSSTMLLTTEAVKTSEDFVNHVIGSLVNPTLISVTIEKRDKVLEESEDDHD